MKLEDLMFACIGLLLLAIVTYMSTIVYLTWYQPKPILEKVSSSRSFRYERPEKTPPIAKKGVRPNYNDAAKWYWDIESNSFRRRVLK